MAGLALGAKLLLPGTEVYGMMVDTDPFEIITPALMRETAGLMEADVTITPEDYHLRDMCGPGYAIASPQGNEAVRVMAEKEGIFLDPVYTGKAFAGLLEMAAEGAFGPGGGRRSVSRGEGAERAVTGTGTKNGKGAGKGRRGRTTEAPGREKAPLDDRAVSSFGRSRRSVCSGYELRKRSVPGMARQERQNVPEQKKYSGRGRDEQLPRGRFVIIARMCSAFISSI